MTETSSSATELPTGPITFSFLHVGKVDAKQRSDEAELRKKLSALGKCCAFGSEPQSARIKFVVHDAVNCRELLYNAQAMAAAMGGARLVSVAQLTHLFDERREAGGVSLDDVVATAHPTRPVAAVASEPLLGVAGLRLAGPLAAVWRALRRFRLSESPNARIQARQSKEATRIATAQDLRSFLCSTFALED